jgi:beta-1,2-mannobiose phosphorylase / 1,2-beta-oligomannan phosphorylase
MVSLKRFPGNPLLAPDPKHSWESVASFNGCPIIGDDGCHLLYRAISSPLTIGGEKIELSTIGHAISFDRVHFLNRRPFVTPEFPWERFGCEDPRVTYMDGTYYIFYTAIASWPPNPKGIAVACATTQDFRKILDKHLVTPFNAKAMTLFPEKINGRFAVILTANSDLPPSTIGIAYLDSLQLLQDQLFWADWYDNLGHHKIPLLRDHHDHVEIGAPLIKTKAGWLMIYSYIKNYRSSQKFFGVEAALLDFKDPQQIIGHTNHPILYPEFDYELTGLIPNIVFPTGALVYNNNLGVYYGAADTRVCLATCAIDELLEELTSWK